MSFARCGVKRLHAVTVEPQQLVPPALRLRVCGRAAPPQQQLTAPVGIALGRQTRFHVVHGAISRVSFEREPRRGEPQ